MNRRQSSIPGKWLILSERSKGSFDARIRALRRGSGILLVGTCLSGREAEHLRRQARRRGWIVADEGRGEAARIHNASDLRRALTRKTRMVLISPIFPTRSHPDWPQLPRMRAATLARLAGRRAIALGGMNDARFRKIERLGFVAWGGIDGWIQPRT